jgi:hypothetical protein
MLEGRIRMLEAAQSFEGSTAVASRPATIRSRVTNGRKLVAGVDGRSADARRFRDLGMSYADDAGGASSLTEAQRALVATAASLTMQAERLQATMLRGEPVNVEQMTRVANSLARTLHRLGIRKAASPKLTVPEFLAARDARLSQAR